MLEKVKNEPVVVAVVGFIAATVALLLAFGVHVTPDQREAIEAWVIAGILLAVTVRGLVSPTRKAAPAPAQPPVLASVPAPPEVPPAA